MPITSITIAIVYCQLPISYFKITIISYELDSKVLSKFAWLSKKDYYDKGNPLINAPKIDSLHLIKIIWDKMTDHSFDCNTYIEVWWF